MEQISVDVGVEVRRWPHCSFIRYWRHFLRWPVVVFLSAEETPKKKLSSSTLTSAPGKLGSRSSPGLHCPFYRQNYYFHVDLCQRYVQKVMSESNPSCYRIPRFDRIGNGSEGQLDFCHVNNQNESTKLVKIQIHFKSLKRFTSLLRRIRASWYLKWSWTILLYLQLRNTL